MCVVLNFWWQVSLEFSPSLKVAPAPARSSADVGRFSMGRLLSGHHFQTSRRKCPELCRTFFCIKQLIIHGEVESDSLLAKQMQSKYGGLIYVDENSGTHGHPKKH